MNIADKLRSAVASIPLGEHTAGLTAIVRHVEAAIGHYDRADQNGDVDAFTDCIYRTNQAYEGSLKETFRIITGEDPSKKSLFEIENTFSNDKNLRSRVINQMNRYRVEYRNPSTHDYKLDFDGSEALLAILSVCGFAVLLASQMRERVEADQLKNDPDFQPHTEVQKKSNSVDGFAESLSYSIQTFLNDIPSSLEIGSREPLALVTAFLDQSGLNIERNVYVESAGKSLEWDIIARNGSGFVVPIEIITSRGIYSPSIAHSRIDRVTSFARISGYSAAILVEGATWGSEYICEKVVNNSTLAIYRVGRPLAITELN